MTSPRFKRYCSTAVLIMMMLDGMPAYASFEPGKLIDLSLEELSNIKITSVSKRAERLSDAPTSVYVITADDIRRAGALSLPQALRLAPNLQVAQTNASGYSISARGFNGSSANKLLVLIDGRSVYTPLFSGVFWDVQDVMMEDIERIEVISGPGGTLWGVNAVNGVINIITRSAHDTQGKLLSVGSGNSQTSVAARYGAAFGDDGHYRLYAKHAHLNNTNTASGSDVDDAGNMSQVGFRSDWVHKQDQLSVQGNAYQGERGQPKPGSIVLNGVTFNLGDIPLSGVNLIAQWEHGLDSGSSFTVQGYFDQTERDIRSIFSETLDIVDLQFQYSVAPKAGHTLVWGGEYRYGMDKVSNDTAFFAFLPAHVNQKWVSIFAQDEIAFTPNVHLTLGARIEHNDYTGKEFLPNMRLAWKLAPDHLLWGAASHPVRAPSRLDRDVFASIPVPPPSPIHEVRLIGGPQVRSEAADVYELGYRGQPSPQTSFSITAFRAYYDHLRTQETQSLGSLILVSYGNGMKGVSSGIELWGTYQVSSTWRLRGGYTNLHEVFQLNPASHDKTGLATAAARDPHQSWVLRSSHDLPWQTELDVALRHVSALSSPVVPAYLALDIRYGWRPQPNTEISIGGQNLLGTQHAEFSEFATRSKLGPSVFFNVVSLF